MAETPLTTSQADALSGTSDSDLDFTYLTIGQSPYYTTAFRCWEKIVRIVKAANALRVYKDGDLTFGVRAGRYMDGGTVREYSGATGQSLTNNDTNYVYLTVGGTLTVNTTGFPDAGTTPHIPLATIETSGGEYDHGDITDYRGPAIFQCATALTPAGMNTLATYLANGFDRAALAEDALARYQVPLMGCRNADGTCLDATGGAGKLSIHNYGWGVGHLALEGESAQGNTKTDTLCFEFVLPPEFVGAADAQLVVHARYAGSGTAGTCTIDAEVYELDDEGTATVIRSSGTNSLTSSWADHTFDNITTTDLVCGDRLMVLLRTAVQETGGSNSLAAEVGNIEMQLDIRG